MTQRFFIKTILQFIFVNIIKCYWAWKVKKKILPLIRHLWILNFYYQAEWLNRWVAKCIVVYYCMAIQTVKHHLNSCSSRGDVARRRQQPAEWVLYSSFIFLSAMMHPLLDLWPRTYGSERIIAAADCCLRWPSDTDLWGYLEMAQTWWTRWLFHVLSW